MKRIFASISLAVGFCSANAHPCEKNAIEQAHKLISFNSNNDDRAEVDTSSIKELKKIKNPTNDKTYFDVLQIYGSAYKGTYRMRFIYYRGDNDCVRVGQEIIEVVDY